MQTDGRSALLLSLIVVAMLVWGGMYIHRTSFVHGDERVYSLWDDAMISMQYARNLREGNGLVWNAGRERVQGFTNVGVTLTMAALHFLPLSELQTSLAFQVLTLAMLAAMIPIAWGIARRMFPEAEPIAWGSAIAMLLCAPVTIWSLQGSDVPFVTLWLLSAAWVLAGPSPGTLSVLLVLGSGLFIRPDTVIFYLPLLACAAYLADRSTPRLLLGVTVLAAAVGAQMGFSWLYYGDPLPNTYYLKATGTPRPLMLTAGFGQLLAWLPFLAIPIALAVVELRRGRKKPQLLLFAALIAIGHAYNLWVGGDFLAGYGSRFAVPTLPLLLILATAGAWRLFVRWAPGRVESAGGLAWGFLGVVALVAIVANPPVSTYEWLSPSARPMNHNYNKNNFHFARYLREHTNPDTTLGVYWGGVPVYFSDRPAIDLLGKSDRHIARMEVDRFIPGHSKWDWQYILRKRKPDVIRAPSRGLGERRRFRRAYVKVITKRGLNFFVRRDAVEKLNDESITFVDLVDGKKFQPDSD